MANALLLAALLLAAGQPPAAPAVKTPATPEAKAPQAPAAPAAESAAPASAPEAGAVDPRAEALPRRSVEGSDATARTEKSDKGEPTPTTRALPSGNLPPSLTARALLDELRRAAKDRRSEQASLGDQRQKLADLQREIASSRAALREETVRLQELVAASARAGRKDASKKSKESAIDTLAKTVRGMKPDAAATMLTRLDRGLAAAILGRMRPADAALVLDKMEPATGASLVALLAGRDRS